MDDSDTDDEVADEMDEGGHNSSRNLLSNISGPSTPSHAVV